MDDICSINIKYIRPNRCDIRLHPPPPQRVLSWSINVVKVSVEKMTFFSHIFLYGIDRHASMKIVQPSTSTDSLSLSHCHN